MNTGAPSSGTVWSGGAAVPQEGPRSSSDLKVLSPDLGSVPLVGSGLVTGTLMSLAGGTCARAVPLYLRVLLRMRLRSLRAVETGPLWAEAASRGCGLFSLFVVS